MHIYMKISPVRGETFTGEWGKFVNFLFNSIAYAEKRTKKKENDNGRVSYNGAIEHENQYEFWHDQKSRMDGGVPAQCPLREAEGKTALHLERCSGMAAWWVSSRSRWIL